MNSNVLVLRLRDARRMTGMKQREVAKKTGIGLKSISSWESGHRDTIKVSQLSRLAEVYDVPLDRLLCDTECVCCGGSLQAPDDPSLCFDCLKLMISRNL